MKKYLPIYCLLILGILARFLPHLANFTPVAAIAIFGGIYLPKRWSILAPLTIMLISDIFIGFYSLPIMASVYLGFVASGLVGLYIRKHKSFGTTLGGTVLSSLFFFLLTNAAVWAFGSMYTRDLSGLAQSYYMALPFFKNSLAGDLFFVSALVGGYEFITNWQKIKKMQTEKI